MSNKFDEVRAETLAKQACVVCICETWLTDRSNNNCFQIDDYSAYFSHRSSTKKLWGGGVAIYVHHDIVCQPVAYEANSETINVCAVTIGCKNDPLLIVSVYRSPEATYEDTKRFCTSLNRVIVKFNKLLIVGDFNPLCWPRAFRLISQLATEHNLHQLVTFAMREQSILDLIYVSHHYYTAIVEDLPPVASADHHMIIITLKDFFKQRLQKQYSIIDYAKLDQILVRVNWHSYFLGCYCVDNYADVLTNVLLDAIHQCTHVRSACRRPRLPKYIVPLLQKKKRTWTFYKNSGNISSYLTAQRTAQAAIHQYRRNCEVKLVYSNNRKAFFAHVNRNIKSEPSNIALSVNSVVLSD